MEASHFVLFAFVILNISSIALSLRCQMCGPYGEPCTDDANVTSVDCLGSADRCMTFIRTTMTTPNAEPQTRVMKNCAHSTIICQKQGQGYPCKEVPFGDSCNVECCDGDMCNQASSEGDNTTSHNETNSGVAASSLKCEACGPDGNPCDGDNVTSVQCGGFADRCMTVSVTIGSNTMMMKNCAHSTLNCKKQSQYNPCNLTASFGGSCNFECCEGDMCNQVNTTAGNSTKPEVTAIRCYRCHPDVSAIAATGGAGLGSVDLCNNPTDTFDCGQDPNFGSYADACFSASITMNLPLPNISKLTYHVQGCAAKSMCSQLKKKTCDNLNTTFVGIPGFGISNCDISCCEGDLCNNPSGSSTTASSLKCEACGPGAPCGGDNVRSVECGRLADPGADRCITVTITNGFNTLTMKNCANSTVTCQEQSQFNPCKLDASLGGSCNFECCEGDMCNQVNTTTGNSTKPEVAASPLKCEVCGPDGNPCDGDNVTSDQCGIFADRCMTVSMTIGSNTMMMKNCAHSKLNCQKQSQYNPCNLTASFGGSCNFECCEGDMCNQINTTAGNSTKPEVTASSLKCEACGPDGDPCDGDNVTSVDCGRLADRCLTVSMKMGDRLMLVKNCGYSTLNCQEQSQYNPCKVAPFGASCNTSCCEGDMCNLVSPSTTVAPSTTVSSPSTPRATEPPPAVVKGRFFKVNSSPVCFGSKNNDFGRFSVPSTGDLAAIKLVHLYGYVACYSTAKWSLWGCGGPKVNVVITTSANDAILPPAELSAAGHWAIIPGYTSFSPELVLSVFSRTLQVTSGEDFHLWYGEDFVDANESDNRGIVCSDVYALYV